MSHNQHIAEKLAPARRREDRIRLESDLTELYALVPRSATKHSRPARLLYDDSKRGRRSPFGWAVDYLDTLIAGGAPLAQVEAIVRRILAYVRGRYRRQVEPSFAEVILAEARVQGASNAALAQFAMGPSEVNRMRAVQSVTAHLTTLEMVLDTLCSPRLLRRSA